MNRKMMYALAAVVVIILVVAVAGAYVLMNGGSGSTVKVADATSLQYNADVSYKGETPVVFTWAAKNVGATNMVLRIDLMGGESGGPIPSAIIAICRASVPEAQPTAYLVPT